MRKLRVSRLLQIIMFISSALILSHPAAAQGNYKLGKENWEQGRYKTALRHLKLYRKEPYGRRAEVDYMLGTSGCRINKERQWGVDVLDWMLYAYSLSIRGRKLVDEELQKCSGRSALAAPSRLGSRLAWVPAGMRARGKTFHWVNKDQSIVAYPARQVRNIPERVFTSRLVSIGNKRKARTRAGALTEGFQIKVFDRFIIASKSRHSQGDLRNVANRLNQYLEFFVSHFHFAPPNKYITVYLVPDIRRLQELAKKLHGLDVSPATIGYSFQDDLSIVGVIPGTAVGTLLHELFHLAVRNNFGDIPPWLDEGVAALYEVSFASDQGVWGVPNWRGKVLTNFWELRPSLREVIQADWSKFSELEKERPDSSFTKRQAVFFAMARYFALYLQENKMLARVLIRFRDRPSRERSLKSHEFAVRLVEKTFQNRPIAEIQEDFENWFNKGNLLKKNPPRGEVVEK